MSEVAETIRIECECGKKLKVPAAAAGKRVKCPNCQTVMTVPVPEPAGDEDDLLSSLGSGSAVETPPPQSAGGAIIRCPNCAAGISASAAVCTSCGFNTRTGKVAATTFGGPKGGGMALPAVGGLLTNPGGIFVGGLVVVGILFGIGKASADLAWPAYGMLGLVSLAIGIWVIVTAFREGIGQGLLCMCVPFYALYYVFARNDDARLKAAFGIFIISNIASYLIQPEMGALETGD